jgi:benzil reductase ((S)-benzoin forming)
MNIVIVTGVSRGLGEAIASALLARGVQVLGVGRKSAPRLGGERYRFVELDLANVDAIDVALEAPFRELARERPARACLVNNAATAGPVGIAGTLAAREIAASLAINLAAPIAVADLFCRVFGAMQGDRRIVNVSSGAAVRPIPGGGLYSIAKAGLEMLTHAIAAEQGSVGIRAVSLRPGIIDTGMQVFMRSQSEESLPSVGMFRGFHTSGQLVAPDIAASRIVEKIVLGPVEQGRTYSYAEL